MQFFKARICLYATAVTACALGTGCAAVAGMAEPQRRAKAFGFVAWLGLVLIYLGALASTESAHERRDEMRARCGQVVSAAAACSCLVIAGTLFGSSGGFFVGCAVFATIMLIIIYYIDVCWYDINFNQAPTEDELRAMVIV